MARLPSFITRHETARGVRYEARINTTLSSGKRLQHRKRFASLDAAKAWHSSTAAALASGTFTAPSSLTVRAAVEAWLAAKSARVKITTAEAYTAALRPVVDAYGVLPVQKVTQSRRRSIGDGAAGRRDGDRRCVEAKFDQPDAGPVALGLWGSGGQGQ